MKTEIPETGKTFYSISEALQDHYGTPVSIKRRKAVYGGDINRSYCLELSNGEKCFLKTNDKDKLGMFMAEAHGLAALEAADAISVPQVYGAGRDQDAGGSFLLMEYLDQAHPVKDYWERFGRDLAALHRALKENSTLQEQVGTGRSRVFSKDLTKDSLRDTIRDSLKDPAKNQPENNASVYGFFEDNFIGATPQNNSWKKSFINFYRDCRLIPQMQMAKNKLGKTDLGKLDKLISRLDRFLAEPDFPALLHGDLWSGNAICGPDGKAWILDPAVYLGSYEADLAMTQLFGGFPSRFYEAYGEVNPIDSGYADRRRIYDLYHMLNHLNLFGAGYAGSVRSILDFYV